MVVMYACCLAKAKSHSKPLKRNGLGWITMGSGGICPIVQLQPKSLPSLCPKTFPPYMQSGNSCCLYSLTLLSTIPPAMVVTS